MMRAAEARNRIKLSMKLTTSESMVWVVPAPLWARRKANTLVKAQAANEITQETLKEEIARLPFLTEYRFTFSTVTILEEQKRENLIKSAREVFEAHYHITPPNFTYWFIAKWVRKEESPVAFPEGEDLDRDQAAAIWVEVRDMADWATFMSCLTLFEQRQAHMVVNGSSDPPWLEKPVPVEWHDYQEFIKGFPRPLITNAIELCNSLNPGLWEAPMDEDSKNFGGVSVHG